MRLQPNAAGRIRVDDATIDRLRDRCESRFGPGHLEERRDTGCLDLSYEWVRHIGQEQSLPA